LYLKENKTGLIDGLQLSNVSLFLDNVWRTKSREAIKNPSEN
jgi:hypothetical protein